MAKSVTVPSCPICGVRIELSGIVKKLPGPEEEHALFGQPGERFIKHKAGAHVHFRRKKNGRSVEAYAYIKDQAKKKRGENG